MIVKGKLVDILARRIYPAELYITNNKISAIRELNSQEVIPDVYICPGFIDSHVHVESSMLIPSEFARLAVVHGTVGKVSDPHEIANVCGMEGVAFMIENGKQVPFKFNFGAPSCVPATIFETAGAELNVPAVARLLARREVRYLSEVMNFPGVLGREPSLMAMIYAAQKLGKQV